MIRKNEVRQDILDRPCEKCGKGYAEDEDRILTFYRGEFITLHEGCSDFIDNPMKEEEKDEQSIGE